MKLYRSEDAGPAPVSHDPELMKRILAEDPAPMIRRVSSIGLRPGQQVSPHSHADITELFYCLEGAMVVAVSGARVELLAGDLLVIEPEELHSIDEVLKPSRLLYFTILSS